MLLERSMSRLVRRTLTNEPPEARTPSGASEWQTVTSVLSAADELCTCPDLDSLTRRAVEMLRKRIGLERVGLFLHDTNVRERLIMRGTWGTGVQGEITDERGLHYEASESDFERFRRIHSSGSLWLYHSDVGHFSEETGQSVKIGHGWLAITPLVTARHVVGVLYNDTALSHSPVDESKQALAAVFMSLFSTLILARRSSVSWGPLPQRAEVSELVKWVVVALNRDPLMSGERLAHDLGISPGHLARSFKSQMGISLVEYRNRLRIDRFLNSVADRRGSLLDAALAAGFGSYAQFHRVYRKIHGQTPRTHLAERGPTRDG